MELGGYAVASPTLPTGVTLLDSAFHGRDRLSLGAYDEGFASPCSRPASPWCSPVSAARWRAPARRPPSGGWELRVFTPTGSAAWLRVEALRRFLAQSPPTAVDEAVASRQAGRYTAWAVALGEAERWSRLVSDLTSATRDRSQAPYDTRGVLYAGYAPMFVTHCCTASTAPSASSGGSGAGVGVGGGAGGGGGGSW